MCVRKQAGVRVRTNKRMHPPVRLITLVLLLSFILPCVTLGSSGLTDPSPEAQLRAAIDNLRQSYTQVINDPDYDVSQLKNNMDFTGVFAWSYSGERTWREITLRWQFEWYDAHAVLAAHRNPTLYARLNAKQKKLADTCAAIYAAIIKPEMTDYEKVLAIHDYIVLHCEYDEATASRDSRSGGSGTSVSTDITPFSAYGALVEGKAVCQGYAEAAHILFEMAGIENYRPESADHVWNLVKIDDEYYHLDITWNDPIGNKPDALRYDYFNLTDAQMEQYAQHDWLNRDRYPAANGTKYNYYVYNKLVANNYTALKQLVASAIKAGEKKITLWVADDTARVYNWPRDLAFIFNYVKHFQYIPPEEPHRILTLLIE